MTERPTLEIAAHSLSSAIAAAEGGADRLELCMALPTGGLTPSAGLIRMVQTSVDLPIHVLIRSRLGGFVYTEEEVTTMLASVQALVDSGVAGVVIGGLTPEAEIDEGMVSRMVEVAVDMEVTFHRAFDFVRDPEAALEQLISRGVVRVLTSGGAPSAMQGIRRLKRIIDLADDRIQVMPGAGVTSDNIGHLHSALKAPAYHASAKKALPPVRHEGPDLSGGMAFPRYETDVEEVRLLKRITESFV